jgi:hypothetical protein
MDQNFKDAWTRKLQSGSHKRQRYNLSSDDGGSQCVMAVALETAVELHLVPDCDMQGRDLLTEEELKAIGLSSEAQFYLSTMNDTYVATSKDKFPMRIINAVRDLPVREKVPLLIELKRE